MHHSGVEPLTLRNRYLNFLPSELTTIGLVLWGSARFFYGSSFPFSAWAGALLAWSIVILVASTLGRHLEGIRANVLGVIAYGFGVGVIMLIARYRASSLSLSQAAAVGIMIGSSLAVNRWLLSVAVGRRTVDLWEGLRWAAVQAVGAYAIAAYVHCARVGAGDAYHYSLMIADFISQARAGLFPTFIGQSIFAFNGGVHTIRTAPYFVHLGAAIDVLTLHTLPAYAMANLTIVFSAWLGALGAYTAMRIYAPARANCASALACLYILSPALLAPLYEGDMFATFMTVPMIPWWVLGLALAADDPRGWRPWIIQSAALAAMWLAHPPTALWATVLTIGCWVVILARERKRSACIGQMTAAVLLFALLAGYEFVSVHTLGLPPGSDSRSAAAAAVIGSVSENWRASLRPLSANTNLLGDIQLGYPLAAAAMAGLFAIGTRKSAAVLIGCMAALFVLLLPVPGITARLWSMVPHAVLDVTNSWPMQRFYPLLAGLAAFSALSAAPRSEHWGGRPTWVLAMAVAACLAWSLWEAHTIHVNCADRVSDEAVSAKMLRPENVSLTRSSYLLFGFFPDYFSHSPMDPFLETRLIDVSTMAVFADGSTTVSGKPPPGAFDVDLVQEPNGGISPEMSLKPRQTVVLRFDFLGRDHRGSLQLSGETLFREYHLPTSGEGKSFGSGPGNSRAIGLQNTSDTAESIRTNYIPDSSAEAAGDAPRPFARVTVEPLETAGHVIELHSLLPFRASVTTDRSAVLETPRIHLPGYHATVNGGDVDVFRTPEGLVGVPVRAGTSDVVVSYPGSPVLRWAYGVCGCAWLSLALCGMILPIADPSGDWRRRLVAPGAALHRAAGMLPFLVLALVVLALATRLIWPSLAARREGAIRLVVRMPLGAKLDSEPLVTTGRSSLGDVIFVSFLGNERVSVGHDFWGRGAAVSKPIAIDFLVPQVVEISMESLAQPARWWSTKPAPGPSKVSVKWNGQEILLDEKGSNPPGPEDIEIGRNNIGASTCIPTFTGEVIESEAIAPWKP